MTKADRAHSTTLDMPATDTAIGRWYQEMREAWDAWSKAPEDSAEQDELQARIDALELEIANQPAEGPRGILIKLHLADRILDLTGTFRKEPQWHVPERLVTSAMDDARRLAGTEAERDGFTAPIFDKDAEGERDFWSEAAEAIPLAYDPDADLNRLWKERSEMLTNLLTMAKVEHEQHPDALPGMVRSIQIAVQELDEKIADIEPQHWHSVVLQASILAVAFHQGKRRDAIAGKIARRIVRWAGTEPGAAPQTAERVLFSPEWQALAASEAVAARALGEQHWQARMQRNDLIHDRIKALRAEARAGA